MNIALESEKVIPLESNRLEMLKQIADALAAQFGPNCEVVIHDLSAQNAEPDADSRHLCGRGSPRQGGPPADHRLRGRRCGGPGGLPLLCLTPGHLLKNPYRPLGVPGGLCCSLHSSRRGGDFSVWAGSQDTVHPMERRPPVFRRPPGVYLMAKVTETVTCCSPSSPPCATQ